MPQQQAESDLAFSLLEEGVQRQLYRMAWRSLRAIQAEAIRAYASSADGLLIMAETAGGKTEAAFLPVLSEVSRQPAGSVRAMYVGPLKALINDQFGRLEELCSLIDVPVHRWHGDVSASQKSALVRNPGGVLLITPESIESLLINRTSHLRQMFGGLRAIVIDELHSFLEGERGLHLASLLSRLREYQGANERPARMIGLSATIGDPDAARHYLQPDAPERVRLITDSGAQKEIQFKIHGYVQRPSRDDEPAEQAEMETLAHLAEDMVEHCRTHSNLVFANAKGDIEILADLANQICRRESLPESFLVHHGSLSKEVRQSTEESMKAGRALTTICSSTLEMGIDIGSVRMVGQIGAPWSVSSFKQRLGRSGRRDDEPRRLRGYVTHELESGAVDPVAELPLDLLQAVAVCELMLERWVEPPRPSRCDFSTLAQQVMSSIAELGSFDRDALYKRLCVTGPFRAIGRTRFDLALDALVKADVVERGPDGRLILGLLGEKLKSRKDFYAAFATPSEFTLIAGDKTLGTLPVRTMPKVGQNIIFSARRWIIEAVDLEGQRLVLRPSRRGGKPKFLSEGGEIHIRIRQRMASLLTERDEPAYLDKEALAMLRQARESGVARGLGARMVAELTDKSSLWWTWTGTREQRTLMAVLTDLRIEAYDRGVAVECMIPAMGLRQRLHGRASMPMDLQKLAAASRCPARRKYDDLFPESLLLHSVAEDLMEPVVLADYIGAAS
jgi:ATP-dependent Lhr-like helicase